jgi:DNA-3-methyladenine glycosylase II
VNSRQTRAGVRLALPADFPVADCLAFHGRDPAGVAERLMADGFCKALRWQGRTACLRISFQPAMLHAELDICGDAAHTEELRAFLVGFLGLDQPLGAFARTWRKHPQLAPLLAAGPPPLIARTATPFEALGWAILSQQISVAAALGLRRRLIQTLGRPHPSGLVCPPEAEDIASLDESRLRDIGLSASKAGALREAARQIVDGRLAFAARPAFAPTPAAPETADAWRARLLAIRGIGPWTADYTLLRGFGHLDASLHGDAGVQRGLGRLLGLTGKADAETTRAWLAPFTPWRALAAALLWRLA